MNHKKILISRAITLLKNSGKCDLELKAREHYWRCRAGDYPVHHKQYYTILEKSTRNDALAYSRALEYIQTRLTKEELLEVLL